MHAAALLLCACSAEVDLGKGDTGPPADTAGVSLQPVEASFFLALQRGAWGAALTRCQVEAAFLEVGVHDGWGSGAAGAEIAYPGTPGSCAFTDLSAPGTAEGRMSVRGSRDAGEAVLLADPDRTLTLARTEDADGLYYALDGCSEEVFPFSAVLDVSAPGAPGADGLPAITAEAALATGPDVALGALPDPLDERGYLLHAASDDLALTWTRTGALPEVDGVAVTATPYLVLRNFHPGEAQPFQALACAPAADGSVTAPAADLLRLDPLADEATGDPYVAAQLDTWYQGPPFAAVWGQSARVTTLVTEGGVLLLLP